MVYKDDTHLIATLRGDSKKWEVTYPKVMAADTFKGLAAVNVIPKPEKAKGFPWGSLFPFLMIAVWTPMLVNTIGSQVKTATSKARGLAIQGTRPTTTFDDVKGLPEVVIELAKTRRHPQEFRQLHEARGSPAGRYRAARSRWYRQDSSSRSLGG